MDYVPLVTVIAEPKNHTSDFVIGNHIVLKENGEIKHFVLPHELDANNSHNLTLKDLLIEVYESSICVFTGKYDKDHTPIFDGDWVSVDGYGIRGEYEVFWDETTAMFAIENYNEDVFEHSTSVMKVIQKSEKRFKMRDVSNPMDRC